MKRIRLKKKSAPKVASYVHSHRERKITFGLALVLLGVLTVLMLISMNHANPPVPVQGAEVSYGQ
jgi:hypothetical protein